MKTSATRHYKFKLLHKNNISNFIHDNVANSINLSIKIFAIQECMEQKF